MNSAFREAYDKLLQSISEQNTTLNNAPSYVSIYQQNFIEKKTFLRFRILAKILTVNDNTLVFRKKLRRIHREYQNEQRTVKHIQYGRLKFVTKTKSSTFSLFFFFDYLVIPHWINQ